MYGEKAKYWHEYPGKKCTLKCYYIRLSKGIDKKKAISLQSMRRKSEIKQNGRVCTKCKKMLPWMDFCVDKGKRATNGRSSDCNNCRNKKYREKRKDLEFLKKEKERAKKARKTEKSKLRKTFDNLFYRDKKIQKNREIIKLVKKISRKEARMAKIQYLTNRGIDKKDIMKAYGQYTDREVNG